MAATKSANDAIRRGQEKRAQEQMIQTLREAMFGSMIESCPPVSSSESPAFNVGETLERLFNACGYELQLHQIGIQGTTVLAVKIKPV